MIPGATALVHTTYAHLGVGRTTELIQTEAPLVQTQARHQGLRSLVWVQEEEGVGEPTGSENEPRSSPWFLPSFTKTLRTNDSVPTAIVDSFVFARTLSITLVAKCTATVASATPADPRHPSSLALPA